jgi:hypothetical protein
MGGQTRGSAWRDGTDTALAVSLSLLALLAFAAPRLLNDPDILWHIETARWIAARRALPETDPFSHSMAGIPWIAKEWLAQLVYAAAYDLAGWRGVAWIAAACVALAFGLLVRALTAHLRPAPALVLAATGFLLAAPHVLARPHVLAYPLIVVWAAGLYRAVEERRAPTWRLLPVMALWANLHGGFTLGLALILPAAAEAVLACDAERRRALARRWGGFLALAILAACLTPYGPRAMLVTQRILEVGEALRLIGEWRPQDFGRLGAFELVSLAALALSLGTGFRLPLARIAVLVGLLHMALAHVRNDELVGLIAPLLLAGPLGRQHPVLAVTAGPPTRLPHGARWAVPLALGAAAAAAWMAREPAPSPAYSPAAALAAARAAPVQGAVFNDLGFGGFLIAQHVPTFVDGRLELFGEAFLLRYDRAASLSDWQAFPAIVREQRIGWTLLEPATPLVGLLDRSPGWERVYADAVAVVHRRVAPVPAQ